MVPEVSKASILHCFNLYLQELYLTKFSWRQFVMLWALDGKNINIVPREYATDKSAGVGIVLFVSYKLSTESGMLALVN